MRHSALSEPTQQQDFEGEEAPTESLTRLVSASRDRSELAEEITAAENTRPTTPVPSFYRFLSQHSEDEAYAHVLAGRLAHLAEDPLDPGPRLGSAGDGSREMTSVLSSLARVPYLRRTPRDIPLDMIAPSQAFVLALIDGRATIAQIFDTSPMPVPQVLRILNELLESGIIALRM